ncbi:MAG: hypothetical protein ACFFDG_10845, partial [Promethearchaeota archaeon]
IHGLDEINCPTCRILKSTAPLKEFWPKSLNSLNIKHPLFKDDNILDQKLRNEIINKKISIQSPNFISKPPSITNIPNFENKLFLDRFKDLSLSKEDNFGITKKMSLESPEWKFEEEE